MPEKTQAQENVKLERNRFHGAEFKRLVYVADVEQAHNPKTILDPAYWANVAQQLQPFDRIEARCEDGTWMSELLVLEVGRSYVRVKQLNHYKLTTADVAQSQGAEETLDFQVFWRGQHHKWAVKRLSDGEVIHNGEASRDAAHQWVSEHRKAMV